MIEEYMTFHLSSLIDGEQAKMVVGGLYAPLITLYSQGILIGMLMFEKMLEDGEPGSRSLDLQISSKEPNMEDVDLMTRAEMIEELSRTYPERFPKGGDYSDIGTDVLCQYVEEARRRRDSQES